MNFLAEYRAGRVSADDIEHYSREWAVAPVGSPAAQVDLWDYLGMSVEQYTRWISKGELPQA